MVTRPKTDEIHVQLPDDYKAVAAWKIGEWVGSQSFNNVLLFMILSAIGYGMWYGMVHAIPMHLKQIGDGYKECRTEFRETLKEQNSHNEKVIERVTTEFKDKELRTNEMLLKVIDQKLERIEKSKVE